MVLPACADQVYAVALNEPPRSLREAESTSDSIEYGAAKTAWYSTASCSPRFVGVCYTTSGRWYVADRLPGPVSHGWLLSTDTEAATTVSSNLYKHNDTRTAAPKPVTALT